VLVIMGAAIVIFAVMYFVPGDPVTLLMGAEATQEDILHKKAELGLDKPFFVQLWNFLVAVFTRFDLGTSWTRGTPVIAGLLGRLPRTFLLGFLMVLLTSLVGIPVGVSAAIHRGGWQDRMLMVASMFLISLPEFWLALMLIIVFSLNLGWLPAFGVESWLCYILPVVSGSLAAMAQLARQTRASVLNVVRADYITTARAKGMKEQMVIYRHMFPNALIPIITVVGGSFTRCVGGTIVIEKIFSFPGIGLYISDAISARDYPVIRGGVILIAAFTALIMLLVDLAYAFVDPQIRAQYAEFAKRKGAAASLAPQGRAHPHHGAHKHGGDGAPPPDMDDGLDDLDDADGPDGPDDMDDMDGMDGSDGDGGLGDSHDHVSGRAGDGTHEGAGGMAEGGGHL
jgi:peptide/nickel transport system permease protein